MKSSTLAYAVPIKLYREIAIALLRKFNLSESDIKHAVETAENADSMGVHSHGLAKLVSLLDHVIRVNPDARPRRVQGKPGDSNIVWNGDDGIGTTTAELAIADLVTTLKSGKGIAMSAVNNATHFLWPYHALKAAIKNDVIVIVMTTAGRSEVVPLGGKRPALGTNPITIIIPLGDGTAIIIDCATSAMSFGKLTAMKRTKTQLAPGMAVDADGNETTDPEAAVSPLTAGRLGFGLSLVVEMIAALIGGSTPTLRGKFGQGKKGEKHNCAFFFIGISPRALSGGMFACGRSQRQNLRHVLTSIRRDGGGKIRFPGERRFEWLKLAKHHHAVLLPEHSAVEVVRLAETVGKKVELRKLKKVRIPNRMLQ